MPNIFKKTNWTGFLGETRPILDIEVITNPNPNCVFFGTAEYSEFPPCLTPVIDDIQFGSGTLGGVDFTLPGQNPCVSVVIEWSRDLITWDSENLGCTSPSLVQIGSGNNFGTLYFRIRKTCQEGGLVSPYSELYEYIFPTPNPTSTPTETPTGTPTSTPTETPTSTPTVTPSSIPVFIDPFMMTVKTDNIGTTLGNQFRLNTIGSGYDFDIDWGDSVIETYTGTPGNITHTYPSAGTYQIKIGRIFPRMYFNNSGDPSKLVSIDQWGNIPWTNFESAFRGCNNMDMVATDTPILSGVTTLTLMFNGCTNMTGNTSFNSWDTSTVTIIDNIFQNCSAFNQPLSNWITSGLTELNSVFEGATIFNQDISSWDVSNVTKAQGTFRFASAFNQDISSWDVSNITNFFEMFFNATSFNQPLDSWDVSNGTTFGSMFNGASMFNQELSGWTTSAATDMNRMFHSANSFNKNINSWDVSKVTNFALMFINNTAFNQPLNSWVTSAATTMDRMFARYTNIPVFNQDISSWDTSNVTNMNQMFNSNPNFNQPIGSWNVSKVTNFTGMFEGATAFNEPLSGWSISTASTVNMASMFRLANSFNQDISNWNTSKVTTMNQMFQQNTAFNQPLTNWNTSSATTMANMFDRATAYTQDLSYLDINSIPNGHNFGSFISGTSVSTENYSRTLISFANQVNSLGKPTGCTINNGVRTYNNTNYGGSPYSDGAAARAALVSSGWTITDGGQI